MTYLGALLILVAFLAWGNDMEILPMWAGIGGVVLLGLGWIEKKNQQPQQEAERTKNQQGAFAS